MSPPSPVEDRWRRSLLAYTAKPLRRTLAGGKGGKKQKHLRSASVSERSDAYSIDEKEEEEEEAEHFPDHVLRLQL